MGVLYIDHRICAAGQGLTENNVFYSIYFSDNPTFPFFITTTACSLAAYLLTRLALSMSMEHIVLAVPITVTTPIAFLLTVYMDSCYLPGLPR